MQTKWLYPMYIKILLFSAKLSLKNKLIYIHSVIIIYIPMIIVCCAGGYYTNFLGLQLQKEIIIKSGRL